MHIRTQVKLLIYRGCYWSLKFWTYENWWIDTLIADCHAIQGVHSVVRYFYQVEIF